MYNALTKYFLVALPALVLASCGFSNSDNKAESDPAQMLADHVSEAFDKGDYVLTLELIDSIQRTYPDRKDLVAAAGQYFSRAMEGIILDSIPYADAEMTRIKLEMDSLDHLFTPVAVQGLHGYKVDRQISGLPFLTSTCVQPRLGNETTPWTIAVNIVGKPVNITGMALEVDGTTVTTVLADNARARRVKGANSEMFSFGPEESEPIANAIETNPGSKIVLRIVGANGEKPISLSEKVCDAIVRTHRLAGLREADRQARKNRELLERKLLLARDQIANSQTIQ